jgi:hypothetical protein
MPIRDTTCGASADDERYFESVYIEPRVIATTEQD